MLFLGAFVGFVLNIDEKSDIIKIFITTEIIREAAAIYPIFLLKDNQIV